MRCREVIGDEDFEKWTKGEEVDMPFLTIGKEGQPGGGGGGGVSESELGRDGSDGVGGSAGGNGEGRGGFEWPAGSGSGSGSGSGGFGSLGTGGNKPTKDEMKKALGQLGEYIKDTTGPTGTGTRIGGQGGEGDGVDEGEEGEEQEVLFFTIDDQGEGEPVMIETEIGIEGGGVDRDMVMKLVKAYLKNKDKPQRTEGDDGDTGDEGESRKDDGLTKGNGKGQGKVGRDEL